MVECSLPADLLYHTVMFKVCLTASKNGLSCGRSSFAKSLNFTEFLASKVFGFPTSLDLPNTFSFTCLTILSPFT